MPPEDRERFADFVDDGLGFGAHEAGSLKAKREADAKRRF
jgi:hypothetical protein